MSRMALGELRIFRTRKREWPVIVVVRPDCVLYHEGRTYGEGDLLRLSVDEARQLEEQGVVLRPS
jgi:hypothetical protein